MNDKSASVVAAPQLKFAGLWPRFSALLLDFLLLSLIFLPTTRIVKGVWLMKPYDHEWVSGWFITDPLCMAFLVAILLYFVLFEALLGATPGKLMLHLRVVDTTGKKPGLARSLSRNILRAVDSLPAFNILGVVLILRSPERARFGDRIAGTRVVRSD